MSYTFRPAVRENTPLIIGLAGPTKSGKTYSAHRLAIGLAGGKPIAMMNAEGARGHQYADKFKYLACDLKPPYRPDHYREALQAAAALNPGVIIIDSASHMHDGPGGKLEWKDEVALKMAKGDRDRMEKMNASAWGVVNGSENQFIYAMLEVACPIVLCFRAKEKVKITKGGDWIDLGWQPIAGERVAFETIFTLMLPPHSKGVPDLDLSDMREPFDTLVPKGKPIDEELGKKLAGWAKANAPAPADPKAEALRAIKRELAAAGDAAAQAKVAKEVFGVDGWKAVEALPLETLQAAITVAEGSDISQLEAACIVAKETTAA